MFRGLKVGVSGSKGLKHVELEGSRAQGRESLRLSANLPKFL